MQDLTLEALKAKTTEFRGRLSRGATLDDLLPEAFAVVREVSSRVLRLRHYDVQMVRPPPGDRPAFQKGPDWPQALRCAVVRNVPNCMLRLRHHEVQLGRPAWEFLWPKGRSPCSTTECRHLGTAGRAAKGFSSLLLEASAVMPKEHAAPAILWHPDWRISICEGSAAVQGTSD